MNHNWLLEKWDVMKRKTKKQDFDPSNVTLVREFEIWRKYLIRVRTQALEMRVPSTPLDFVHERSAELKKLERLSKLLMVFKAEFEKQTAISGDDCISRKVFSMREIGKRLDHLDNAIASRLDQCGREFRNMKAGCRGEQKLYRLSTFAHEALAIMVGIRLFRKNRVFLSKIKAEIGGPNTGNKNSGNYLVEWAGQKMQEMSRNYRWREEYGIPKNDSSSTQKELKRKLEVEISKQIKKIKKIAQKVS